MSMDFNFENTFENIDFNSGIPGVTLKSECILGIDEAGRGPVLGPMVYAAAYYPLDNEKDMAKMDFADSKVLTEEKREQIFEKINSKEIDCIGWIAKALSPAVISNSMLKRCKYNLNTLSHDTAIGLIQKALDDGILVTKVFVDTVGPPEKYEQKLSDIFPQIKIKVSKKADSLYPVVSAASICAKVIRDRIIKNWIFIENLDHLKDINYGSGYPADPSTQDFLKKSLDKVFGFPNFVRFSWSTASKIIDENCNECVWQDDELEDEAEDTKSRSILEFFNKKPRNNDSFVKETGSKKSNLPKFFTYRNLMNVTSNPFI